MLLYYYMHSDAWLSLDFFYLHQQRFSPKMSFQPSLLCTLALCHQSTQSPTVVPAALVTKRCGRWK